MKTESPRVGICLLIWAVALCQGCALSRNAGNEKQKEAIPVASAENPVFDIVSMWKPAQGLGLDKQRTRGFAGQVLFFTKGNPVPALVKSKVRICLYKMQDLPHEGSRLIHQFDYEPDAWNLYARETALGPIYSVFIPYTIKSDERVRCRLQVKLMPDSESEVASTVVDATLPRQVTSHPSQEHPIGDGSGRPTPPSTARAEAPTPHRQKDTRNSHDAEIPTVSNTASIAAQSNAKSTR